MIQLDLEKAYGNVSWSFVAQLMSHMGFDARTPLSFMLGLGLLSHVMLNGVFSDTIPLTMSLRQGHPLSPLLFVICG